MTDWEAIGRNRLQRRITAALEYHHLSHWSTGPGCSTCRVLVRDGHGGSHREPAPWPCDTYKALTGEVPPPVPATAHTSLQED